MRGSRDCETRFREFELEAFWMVFFAQTFGDSCFDFLLDFLSDTARAEFDIERLCQMSTKAGVECQMNGVMFQDAGAQFIQLLFHNLRERLAFERIKNANRVDAVDQFRSETFFKLFAHIVRKFAARFFR